MNVEIAERLAARRKQAGLSQEALAEQLGVSRQAVSKWERSESSPDTDNLIALAQLYGVSLDDLLYVDDAIKDDVAFEASDRAAERGAGVSGGTGASAPAAGGTAQAGASADAGSSAASEAAASAPGNSASEPSPSSGKDAKVRIGLGGIHVLDGEDYVHVSWRDGVHVKDSKKGDEVHVGWDGIHVKEGIGASGKDWRAAADAWAGESDPREARRQAARAWYGKDGGKDAARTADAPSHGNDGAAEAAAGQASRASDGGAPKTAGNGASKASDSRCTLEDNEGNEVVIDGDGVVINGEHFDSWRDAHERYGYGHEHEERWNEPCGYTVNGERFDTLDEAKGKYGPEVGRTIPVRKHYLRAFEKEWVKFPYPLVIIVVYLLLGILNGAWGVGLFLFLTIPVYYMVGHAIGRRRIAPLVSGVYPIAVVAWFCYMAFMLNQPHPAWVAFLTIPLVEWLVHSLSRWWRVRKRERAAAENAPIDVEAQ